MRARLSNAQTHPKFMEKPMTTLAEPTLSIDRLFAEADAAEDARRHETESLSPEQRAADRSDYLQFYGRLKDHRGNTGRDHQRPARRIFNSSCHCDFAMVGYRIAKSLFDHLVGDRLQRRRYGEAEPYLLWRLPHQDGLGRIRAFQTSPACLRVAWLAAGRGHARMSLGRRIFWREKGIGTLDNRGMARARTST